MNRNRFPLYAALCLWIIGAFLVFGPLLHFLNHTHGSAHLHVGHREIYVADTIVLPIAGIILIYLSIFVYYRRLLAAYVSMIGVLFISLYLSIIYPSRHIATIIALLVIAYIVIIALARKQFTVKNNLENLSQHLRPILIVICIGFLYGVFGFYVLGEPLFHVQFSLLTSTDLTLDGLTGFSGTLSEPTRYGQLFIDSLGSIGIVTFVLLLEALFRPLRLKVLPYQENANRQAAETIIRAYSNSSEDYFKLWPHDKHYFFSDRHRSFLAYKQGRRTAIILGDPVGDPTTFTDLIAEFVLHCHSSGWRIAAINTTQVGQQLLETHGLQSLFIGNEGVVDIASFIEHTSKDKHFRYVHNKSIRDKLHVEEWSYLDTLRVDKLRFISNEWLSRSGRREYSFFMGYFDTTYLRQSRIFVLFENGHEVAYVNLIPSFYQGHASIDHLRSLNNISSVGMHALLMQIIKQLHSEHIQTLNLGLSPLSGVENSDAGPLPKAVVMLTRRVGSLYYSFQGLEQFKNKFRPLWEPRYLIYSGVPVSLIRITADIERISSHTRSLSTPFYISTAAGITILAIGLYLILG